MLTFSQLTSSPPTPLAMMPRPPIYATSRRSFHTAAPSIEAACAL